MSISEGMMRFFETLMITACLLVAVAISSPAQESRNPNFDFSRLIELYKVADILLADLEPTEEQWSALFDTPGHAELRRREFEDDFLKTFIRAACKPSEREEIARIKAKYEAGDSRYYKMFCAAMFDALEYALANRVVEVISGRLTNFIGNYDDYTFPLQKRDETRPAAVVSTPTPPPQPARKIVESTTSSESSEERKRREAH
ncbi:MAG TPA: hypothetical protein VMX35_08260 [Acidobacteriota bacterium]|nr:hypothetical protein [Acidobacteriota bacterium]